MLFRSTGMGFLMALVVSGVLIVLFRFRRSFYVDDSRSFLSLSHETTGSDTRIWIPVLLSILGWQSLGFFAFALIARQSFQVGRMGRQRIWVTTPLLVAGFALSLAALPGSQGQFWVSADQLWRSSIAAGISRWGFSDFIGATGGTLRFHWLSEGTAGVISRVLGISAVQGVTIVVPTLGVLIAFEALKQVGSQMKFSKEISSFAAAATVVLCREFDVFSLGSLWGIALFIVGLIVLSDTILGRNCCEPALWRQASIVVLLPLITLSQSTLGLNFLLASILTASYSVWKDKSASGVWLLTLLAQSGLLFALRSTLLRSEAADMFSPSVTWNSVLHFRGLDLYLGENFLFVAGVSLLFLFVVSQKAAGLILVGGRLRETVAIRLVLGIVAVSALILANTITMGGSEAQQSRFLSPLVVLVVFISCLCLIDEMKTHFRLVRSRTILVALVSISTLLTIAGLAWMHHLYSSDWSKDRTLGISLSIVTGQALLLILWCVRRSRWGTSPLPRLVSLLLIGGLSSVASGRTLSYLIEFHSSARDKPRFTEYAGGTDAQQCFEHLRRKTPVETIVASNWFRLPPPSRQPKNFMVSAWTERRIFLDGPEYIRYYVDAPRTIKESGADWVDVRYQATDDFAERATRESYEALRAQNVEYFVIETIMPMPTTWEPYADVIFEREPCKVLKLRTEN